MKKTEKIEVRLSHEEKTSLTTLAEQEGRSISDLVRGLIERYMSINTTRLPRKTPWLLFSAIAIGGFFAGHIATYLVAKFHAKSHSPIYNMEVNFGDERVSFPVLAKNTEMVESIIPSKDGDIMIKVMVSYNPGSLETANVSLCRNEEGGCNVIATPKLKFNPNSRSSLSFSEKSGQGIYITLSPTIAARK